MFNIDDLSTWTILLIEDDEDNIEMAHQVLMFSGAKIDQVHTATDGNIGLRILETVKPQVILLDLSMPEMDGWQMYARVRANPETANIPVIAVTAHALGEERRQAKEMGFNGYIIKPYSVMSFVDEIKGIMREYYQAPVPEQSELYYEEH